MTDSITTYLGPNGMFLGPNWCAKCSKCGRVLTKYAFTEQEAQNEALDAGHRCGEGRRRG
jgi:hypothetical protein